MIDRLSTPEVQQFIQDHQKDDPIQLVLQAGKYPDLPIQEIAHQIKCLQKAKTKLPSFASKQGIIYPPGVSLEQSSSEATAQYKAQLVQGKSLTDLTAGFGIDSFYFTQHFEQVISVERNADLLPVAHHNFDLLVCKNIQYVQGDALTYLSAEKQASGVYFLDPARRDGANQKVHLIEDCQPNLLELLPLLIERKATILIKLAPLLDIHLALEKLTNVAEVHVLSIDNECKELLFKIEPDPIKEPNIIAINIQKGESQKLVFDYTSERETATFSEPKKYLYEPNASIMKAGGYHSVARTYGLQKLHRNSHLYTSDELVKDFPGRSFLLETVTVLNKKKLKAFIPDGKANISVRNYPNTVQEIRKKTSIKDGGSVYLFATTLMDGSPKILVCSKVDQS